MKIILLFLVQFLVAQLFAQTYSSVVSNKEIREFMNWVTKNGERMGDEPQKGKRNLDTLISRWRTENFERDTSEQDFFWSQYLFGDKKIGDAILNEAGRISLKEQFSAIKDSVWRGEKFEGARFGRVYPGILAFSLPLFSPDREYVIIYQGFYCGNLCAEGGCYIYRRISPGKWEYVTRVNSWIS